MAILFNMPLDQQDGEKIAIEYKKNNNGYLYGGVDFTEDSTANTHCAMFDGTGEIICRDGVINPSFNYTISFWSKTENPHLFVRQCNGDTYVDMEEFTQPVNQWSHICIVKSGNNFSVYVSNKLVQEFEAIGNLIALSIEQVGSTNYYVGNLYGVKIYNQALTIEEIEMASATTSSLAYLLDGEDIKSKYGVYISDSDGLLDRPKTKTPYTMDWADEHGQIVDYDDLKLSSRDITLKCFIYASDKLSFSVKVNDFLQAMEGGLHRMQVCIDDNKPLVYDVYCKDAVAVDKRWSDVLMVGQFTLKLVEPLPQKKVIRFQSTQSTALSITISQASTNELHLYTISYGDGEIEEVKNASATLSHSYGDNSVHYIIIAGVIDNISVTTNGVIIWDKI